MRAYSERLVQILGRNLRHGLPCGFALALGLHTVEGVAHTFSHERFTERQRISPGVPLRWALPAIAASVASISLSRVSTGAVAAKSLSRVS